jgi:RNA polymerase sigma factor (sigma-70 family)
MVTALDPIASHKQRTVMFDKSDDDVTQWIVRLAGGDQAAAQQLWERYYERLIRLAKRKLSGVPLRAADDEDVVLSAFDSFCEGVAAGRFPQLHDRHDLWKLLVTITVRKAMAQLRRHGRAKRGAGSIRGESAFAQLADSSAVGIDCILGREPSPELAAQVAESCRLLFEMLDDEDLQRVALFKLEGYTNEEIAQQMDCSLRTVKRRLQDIREMWRDEVEP